MRWVVLSEAYGLTSGTTEENSFDEDLQDKISEFVAEPQPTDGEAPAS